ncbi:hypothetical protein U0E23_32195, partial [Burkholderia stagnalis]|uniref:hypothetical protein n=1 Tax=Burkholderia stagnalis TaxID=1503054 RepID=UPI002AB3DF72
IGWREGAVKNAQSGAMITLAVSASIDALRRVDVRRADRRPALHASIGGELNGGTRGMAVLEDVCGRPALLCARLRVAAMLVRTAGVSGRRASSPSQC